MFVQDFYERIIQQHASNLLNNGLRSNHALFTARYFLKLFLQRSVTLHRTDHHVSCRYINLGKNTVCGDLRNSLTIT